MQYQKKCVAVVDGALLVLDDGSMVVLDQVKVPRVGLPGGAAMRTVLQRKVQDQVLEIEPRGKDRQGTAVGQIVVNGVSINADMNQALAEYGYD